MYHVPLSPNGSEPAEMPEEMLVEDASYENDCRHPREAHLRAGQAETRGIFAPFFALAGSACALLTAWALYGHAPIMMVGGWVAATVLGHGLLYRLALSAHAGAGSRGAVPVAKWRPIAEAFALAALWVSLPATAFPALPAAAQIVVGGAIGAMMLAGIALAASPVAAIAWVATMAAGLFAGYLRAAPELDIHIVATILVAAAVAIAGVGRLARWMLGQIDAIASIRARAESIRLLLREYEHRGVGWLWQVDAENRVVYISSRMTALLGRSTSQLIGHSLPASLGGHSALGRTLLARQPFTALEMELNTRRGTRWIALAGDPIIDVTGQFQGFRGVGSDITDIRKTQERLTNLANMDVLSGLPNRSRMRQLLGEALETAQTSQVACAFLFLDLDGFKPVNDTFGHPKGDAVLQGVADRLVQVVGSAGHVGRMGGDEFAIVISDAQSRKSVEDLCARIIAAIAQPFIVDRVEIKIGVSIGCAFGPVDGRSVDDLIQKADLALYQAKANGRGLCCNYNADMQSLAEHRLKLEQDLSEAIRLGQLCLFYQPLIRASDQSLVGFEALIRWKHPVRGMIPPNDFIPLAEETGLIIPMGDWVIEEACRAASTWPAHISVALNLSARQLVMPTIPGTVSAALTKYRVPANRIELEVTESVFLEDSAGSLDVLKRLRGLGVGIALDDFGTGYSSLGYLNKAVFHKLKIDGSFVREAAKNKETVAIIQSIIQLANSFRMTITAEGVETVDDFERMRDLGAHQIQGYLFGKPMEYERATELVRGEMKRLSA